MTTSDLIILENAVLLIFVRVARVAQSLVLIIAKVEMIRSDSVSGHGKELLAEKTTETGHGVKGVLGLLHVAVGTVLVWIM